MTIGERIAKSGKNSDAASWLAEEMGLSIRSIRDWESGNEACVKYHHQALLIARCFFWIIFLGIDNRDPLYLDDSQKTTILIRAVLQTIKTFAMSI